MARVSERQQNIDPCFSALVALVLGKRQRAGGSTHRRSELGEDIYRVRTSRAELGKRVTSLRKPPYPGDDFELAAHQFGTAT